MKNFSLARLSLAAFSITALVGAGVAHGGSAGLADAFSAAGVTKGTAAYYKILSSLNISPFNLTPEEAKEDSFKQCKRRWLTSPAGAFTGLVVEGVTSVTENTEEGPKETKGTFSETLENVTDQGFDLRFAIQMGDQKKQEGVMKVSRAQYIVTCQEIIAATREMDEELLIRYKHTDPKLAKFQVGKMSYQTISRLESMSGFFASGVEFTMQKHTLDTNFGVYRKALDRTDLFVVLGEDEKVETLIAFNSKVNKVAVKE